MSYYTDNLYVFKINGWLCNSIFLKCCTIAYNCSDIATYFPVPCQAVYHGACFAVIPLSMNWFDARDNCVSLGGRLAEVTYEKVNENLKAFVNGELCCYVF